jgi:precorrin-4 methylase
MEQSLSWNKVHCFTAALYLEHILPGKGFIMYVGSMVDPSVLAQSKNETDIVATMDANEKWLKS